MDDRDTPPTDPPGEPSDAPTATRPHGSAASSCDFSLAAPEGGIRRLPARVGPFRIVGVLGAGGMGVVYDAEQEHPRRRVALKVIRDAMLHPDGLRRFAREAEVLGRLQHPGIARVYATGVADGPHGPQPYFATERVAGEPLGRYAERLDRRARLALFALVCDAVHYAHQRGVIHRDLKPANVLVDGALAGAGAVAVAVAGAPKVLDFGVARLTDADVQGTLGAPGAATAATATGEVVGTLFYMSPEQLRGDARALASTARAGEEAAKATAVGGFLEEMLTSADPSVARGRELTVREVLDSAARRVNAPGPLARQPAARAAALATLSGSYDGLGLYPPARRPSRRTPSSGVPRAPTSARSRERRDCSAWRSTGRATTRPPNAGFARPWPSSAGSVPPTRTWRRGC